MDKYETHEYDVVVIGAGGAGLRAAIESSAAGVKTALVCKSLLGKAHTVMAEGGVAASLASADTRDNWETHYRDTIKGGKYLNQWRMAQLHAQESPDRVRELQEWGAVFDRTREGGINQRNFGGHTYPRLAHVGDRTGLEIIRTLQDRGVHQGIDVYMECTIRTILKDPDGHVSGCLGYWRESGRFVVFHAKSIVLATGGIGRCWDITSNSWEYTADGHALALWAGAELIDSEFVQFHPTGMVWPPSVKGTLITEGVRGEGGVLKNIDGERFMFDNIPEMFQGEYAETEEEATRWVEAVVADRRPDARRPPELLTRDVVARAIRREVRAGRGSPHGGVFLDIASKRSAEAIKRKLPSMYHQFKELANVDITTDPMEVGPTCHYTMGGVRVDPESQETRVPGMFAAGEVAGGMHGANRLGGNSLSDLLVFGKRAGEFAARHAADRADLTAINETEVEERAAAMLEPFGREGGENPYTVHEDLRNMMQDKVGIVRTEEDLVSAIEAIASLRTRAAGVKVGGNIQYNPGWHLALDLDNMLDISEAVARSALMRTESRGAHTREDFPDSDEQTWGQQNLVTCQTESGVEVQVEPLPEMPPELKELIKD
ncbi:MAG: fumarate reductase/succinate dehydrogenase flavoprotein subunit [Planctomycetaceae bacterium]|jgi:succinate dehydrogenase / fumarate reductase flavoprotein subunit|nr:fumarate reductase/succinate dehydrogenase flavoprotein subunit [Planctomycetaceae bacterium]